MYGLPNIVSLPKAIVFWSTTLELLHVSWHKHPKHSRLTQPVNRMPKGQKKNEYADSYTILFYSKPEYKYSSNQA